MIEAAGKSGSLITAKKALDKECEVLAVPGTTFDTRPLGCNLLISYGTTLMRSTQVVFEVTGPVALQTVKPRQRQVLDESVSKPHTLQQTAQLRYLTLARFLTSSLADDQLIRDLRANVANFSAALVELYIALGFNGIQWKWPHLRILMNGPQNSNLFV